MMTTEVLTMEAGNVKEGQPHSKLVLFLSIVLSMLVLAWFFMQGGTGSSGVNAMLINKEAPDFEVVGMDGKKIKLSDFRGKGVILHFWATWCPPCASEFPALNKLYASIKDKPVELLAISLDEDGAKAINVFKKKVAFDFPVYLNPTQDIADSYGTYGLPETFFIDKQGKVVKKFVGPQNWNSELFQKQVNNLMK